MTLITRKDIASMLEVSVDQVRKNEAAWGIIRAKVRYNCRCIRYRQEIVAKVLMDKGWPFKPS